MKKDNNNKGCGIIGIILVFFCIWGVMGMVDGHSFFEGIYANIKALFILLGIALALFILIKMTEK